VNLFPAKSSTSRGREDRSGKVVKPQLLTFNFLRDVNERIPSGSCLPVNLFHDKSSSSRERREDILDKVVKPQSYPFKLLNETRGYSQATSLQ